VKLIAGYIRPDSGNVIVDGQDLTDVSLKSYYPHIGYLTQEPSVFDGTIRENLLYVVSTEEESPRAPLSQRGESIDEHSPSFPTRGLGGDLQDRMEEAIILSKCDFIYDFPDGLDTEI
jgi:ABC-type multidrug transport system fused ATPase/permease subunit